MESSTLIADKVSMIPTDRGCQCPAKIFCSPWVRFFRLSSVSLFAFFAPESRVVGAAAIKSGSIVCTRYKSCFLCTVRKTSSYIQYPWTVFNGVFFVFFFLLFDASSIRPYLPLLLGINLCQVQHCYLRAVRASSGRAFDMITYSSLLAEHHFRPSG